MKDHDDAFDRTYDNCIIGSGLSGSTIAQQYATFNQTCHAIEKRSHISLFVSPSAVNHCHLSILSISRFTGAISNGEHVNVGICYDK
jgi:choline dehydrogenase-like flavoprotein